LIAGNFIGSVDADVAMHFTCTAIIEYHVCTGRRVVASTTARELRGLLAGKKGCGHCYRLEG
jgi:hypothetical protein